jgi:multicomponent Na+:H+ antiporter subunit D
MRGSMDMKKLGGLYAEYPKISLLIAIVLFSLAGIPPLSGFWPKIYLLQGAFQSEHYFYAGALIIGSFMTLFILAKFWSEVFWKKPAEPDAIEDKFKNLIGIRKVALILPICILAASSLYIGLNAESIIQVADRISSEMLNTKPYIQAVLGK